MGLSSPSYLSFLFLVFSFHNRVFLLSAGIGLNIIAIQDGWGIKYFQSLHQIVVIRISEI